MAVLESEIHRSENRGSVLSYKDSREGFLQQRCQVDPRQWLCALHSTSREMSASLNHGVGVRVSVRHLTILSLSSFIVIETMQRDDRGGQSRI